MSEITDRNSHEIDPHLTARIVESYVRNHTVGTGQVSELITSVHGALSQLGWPNQPEEVLTPAVPVRQSVRHDYVVCLDCGYKGKMLLRHITQRHGLDRSEYLKRWELRKDHPLTAPGYSEQRSSMAKKLGLGRKAPMGITPATRPTASASADTDMKSAAKPARRRNTRSTSNSNVVSETSGAGPSAKARRSRPRADLPS